MADNNHPARKRQLSEKERHAMQMALAKKALQCQKNGDDSGVESEHEDDAIDEDDDVVDEGNTEIHLDKRLRYDSDNSNEVETFGFSVQESLRTPSPSPPRIPRLHFGEGFSLLNRNGNRNFNPPVSEKERTPSLNLRPSSRIPKRKSTDSLTSLGNISGDPEEPEETPNKFGTPESGISNISGMSMFDSPDFMQASEEYIEDENQRLLIENQALKERAKLREAEHKIELLEKEAELQKAKHKIEMLEKEAQLQASEHKNEIVMLKDQAKLREANGRIATLEKMINYKT